MPTNAERLQAHVWRQKDEYKYMLAKEIIRRTHVLAAWRELGWSPHKAQTEYEAIERLRQQFDAIHLYVPGTRLRDYSPLPLPA